MSDSLPQRSMLAACVITPALRNEKLTSASGSTQNMVDPAVFKKDAGVGNWIDMMVKVEGPVVECIAGTFISDWFLDTDAEHFHAESFLKDTSTTGSLSSNSAYNTSRLSQPFRSTRKLISNF